MQQLLDPAQMRAADQFTIRKQQNSEDELIDRAAAAFVKEFCIEYPDLDTVIAIYCGPGNNGADGLVIAGLLYQLGFQKLNVYSCCFAAKPNRAFQAKYKWLREFNVDIIELDDTLTRYSGDEQVSIDALFGSGLNKPLSGAWLALLRLLNTGRSKIVAVDIPAGLPGRGIINSENEVIHADLVICFQRPSINFFFPESIVAVSRFKVVDIGLDEVFIQDQKGIFQLVEESDIRGLLKPRKRFSHKGTYGHALLIAGQENTMGAALLAASACLYAGVGLCSAAIPRSGLMALNTSLPEVMYLNVETLENPAVLNGFSAIAAGPGLGVSQMNNDLLRLLLKAGRPLVLDADALNVLAEDAHLFSQVPAGTVLTPHMKEFDRLFGRHAHWWERIETARDWTQQNQSVIVLKNQYTFIIDQTGMVYINTTGNPGMAQGGMGDVLTGTLLAMLAQGYHPLDASLIACYVHGKSGDNLAQTKSVIRASDLAAGIPEVLIFN